MVDTIGKVMELDNSAEMGRRYQRQLCILVTHDVTNTFSCTWWDKIEGALARR